MLPGLDWFRCAYFAALLLLIHAAGLANAEISSPQTWNVGVPDAPPFVIKANEVNSNQLNNGLLEELFNHSYQQQDDVFIVEPKKKWSYNCPTTVISNFSWLENGALSCIQESMKQADSNSSGNSGSDLCLFPSTATSNLDFEGPVSLNSTGPVITRSWIRLKPVLLTLCTESTCPKEMKRSIWNAIYFLRVFHSSVWAMICLFVCTTASLFFIFEQSHPFQLGRRLRNRHDPDRFNLQDCFMYTTLALVLRPFPKTPKSWAGLVLSVFWCTFCIVCLIAYAVGTGSQLLRSMHDSQLGNEVVLLARNSTVIACEPNQRWCNALRDRMGYTISTLKQSLTSNSSWAEANPLLTDQLTAYFLLSQGYRNFGNATGSKTNGGGAVRWIKATLWCPVTHPEFQLTDIELGFVATSAKAAWSFNKYLNRAEHSGFLSQLTQRWTAVLDSGYGICRTTDAVFDSVPVGLPKMNGPVVFIIAGSLAALLIHGAQFIFLSYFAESKQSNEDVETSRVRRNNRPSMSNEFNV